MRLLFNKYGLPIVSICMGLFFALVSCKNGKQDTLGKKFEYNYFKDSLLFEPEDTTGFSSNIFDSPGFTPGIDSLDTLLIRFDRVWRREVVVAEQIDSFISMLKKGASFTDEEKQVLKTNVKELESYLKNRDNEKPVTCRQKECFIYAEIVKSTQVLYLYINAELKDSFPVSTGIKKRETPNLNLRPSGPLLMKYNSKKFPGGNYQGLGNMPYAIFLRGGYAIHGTTPGNFSQLGTRASHGCIRLHPFNAKILFELVKLFGLQHTWITIRDSLPSSPAG